MTKALPPKHKHLSSNLWHTCKRPDTAVHAWNAIAGGRDRRIPIGCLPPITNQGAPGSLGGTVSKKKGGWWLRKTPNAYPLISTHMYILMYYTDTQAMYT